MKTMFAGLALGTLLLAGPAARAATTIETAAFTIGWAGGYYPEQFDMTVLSDSGGIIRLALHNVQPYDAAAVSENVNDPVPGGDIDFTQLAATVRAGYRITSLALGATANGTLAMALPDGCPAPACAFHPGYASNEGEFAWSLAQGGAETALPGARIVDLQGQATLAQSAAVALQGEFRLDLLTSVATSALGSVQQVFGDEYYYENMYRSEAAIGLDDFVLTIQIAPVPEPSTYAMLLAGLGVAGWAARRGRA